VGTYVAPTWTHARLNVVFGWTLVHRRILLTAIFILVGTFVAARAVAHLAAHH
jgi:hypothetical protein